MPDRALIVTPRTPGSARIVSGRAHDEAEGSVVVRTIAVGVCGTDRDIVSGRTGTPAPGRNELVIGHEAVGRVESSAGGFAAGDLVTATVRRSCSHCKPCLIGAYDACASDLPPERGIDGLDGFACDYFHERAEHLISVPRSLGVLGVLAEPMSIAEKAVRHARLVGGRQPWFPETALVLGTGAIGLLSAMLLATVGLDVSLVGRSRARTAQGIVEELGGHFVPSLAHGDLAGPALKARADIVIEATGDAALVDLAVQAAAPGGVVCLLGLGTTPASRGVKVASMAEAYVLGNRALIGSVNAAPQDWQSGLERMQEIELRMPGLLGRLVTGRFPPERFADALTHRGIKAILSFD